MNRMLLLCLLGLPGLSAAASFDGTWKLQTDTLVVSEKPLVFALQDGNYKCISCTPQFTIKADGTDQKITGMRIANTLAVTIVDDKTIRTVYKLDGKVMREATDTVSADGRTLTQKMTDAANGTPWSGTIVMSRAGPGPQGAHAISGAWKGTKLAEASNNALLVQFEETRDGLKMKYNGMSYDAKFDGSKVDMAHDPFKTQVSLKRLAPNTIRETDYRDGEARETDLYVLADDNNSIEVVSHDLDKGGVTRYTMTRQSD